MRKQELIHLHALLELIRDDLTADYDPPTGVFTAYERHGVHPRAIYARKDAHHEAIAHLTDGIERILADLDQSGSNPEDPAKTGEPPIES